MKIDRGIEISKIKKILVIATHSIGDVAHSLHSLHSLKLNFPHADFDFLGYEYTRELHEWLEMFGQYYFYPARVDRHGPARLGEIKKLTEVFRKAKLLRKNKYDLAFILPGGFEHALTAWLAGIPHRVASNSDGRGFLLTGHRNLKKDKPNYELMLSLLECIPSVRQKSFFQKKIELPDNIKKHLPPKFFTVGPTASSMQKMWKKENFIELINMIKEKNNWEVVYLGSNQDKEYIQAMNARAIGLNLAGRTNLSESLGVFGRSEFFIGNNSGLSHLSGLANIPVAVLCGPSDPLLTEPYSKKSLMIMSPEDVPDHLREVQPYKERMDVNKITVGMAYAQLEKNNFI